MYLVLFLMYILLIIILFLVIVYLEDNMWNDFGEYIVSYCNKINDKPKILTVKLLK